MRRLILLALAFAAAVVLVPTVAVADSATHTYMLEIGGTQPRRGCERRPQLRSRSPEEAEFSVNPNSVNAAGDFTHTNSSGNVPRPPGPGRRRG